MAFFAGTPREACGAASKNLHDLLRFSSNSRIAATFPQLKRKRERKREKEAENEERRRKKDDERKFKQLNNNKYFFL